MAMAMSRGGDQDFITGLGLSEGFAGMCLFWDVLGKYLMHLITQTETDTTRRECESITDLGLLEVPD